MNKSTSLRMSFAAIGMLLVIFLSSGLPVLGLMNDDHLMAPQSSDGSWEALNHQWFHDDTKFRDVAFINATHGWVVGQNKTGLGNGLILHTKDGGDSWQLQVYNQSQVFTTIEVIDDSIIWVTCEGGLFYTNDSGKTWHESKVIDIQAGLGAVEFINATHGWTSTMGDVYKTIDGGMSWINVTSWTFRDILRMIHFVTPLKAWAIGFIGIYYTDDGGDTWERKHNRGGWTLSMLSESEGWAVADGMLAHMTDGETWVELPLPRPERYFLDRPPYFTDILFLDESHGWIAGAETPIAYTPNGGIDWYAQAVPDTMEDINRNRLMALDFINVTHGWAVGSDGFILRTRNGDVLGTRLWLEGTYQLVLFTGLIGLAAVILTLTYAVIRKRRQSIMQHSPDIE